MSFAIEDRRCALIAAAQHSLINKTQANRAGLPDKAIRYRVAIGRWRRVLPRVYLLAGGLMTNRAWMMAAYLWARQNAAISHSSAAHLWGIDGFDGKPPFHLTTGIKGASPFRLIRLHSIREPAELEVSYIDDTAVTSPRKTLLALASLGHRRLERALDQMLREGATSLGDMWLMIDAPSSFRRRGIRRLRGLLAVRSEQTAPTHSEMEDLLVRQLRAGGLELPEAQHPIFLGNATIHADFAYPETRLAIECDSYAWHMDREAFERDRKRDAELQLMGWTVLRVTWAQLRYNPEYVLDLIRRHLSREVERTTA
jgi:very-short-patch-repair endonuclease